MEGKTVKERFVDRNGTVGVEMATPDMEGTGNRTRGDDVSFESEDSFDARIPDAHPKEVRNALDRFVASTLRPVAVVLAIIFLHAAVGHWARRDQPLQLIVGLYDLAGALAFIGMSILFTRRPPHPKWANPIFGGIGLYVLGGDLIDLWFFATPTIVIDLILLVFGLGVLILSVPWFVMLLTVTVLSWVVLALQVFPDAVFESLTVALMQATAIAGLLFFIRFHTHSRLERLRMRDHRRQKLLQSAVRSLHESDESRRGLLRAIVHDMAAPVTTMKAVMLASRGRAVSLTADDKPGRLIGRSIVQLESFLSDLRDLDAIESHRFEIDREPIDLAEVARTTKEAYEDMAEDKGLDLQLETDGPLPVQGDRWYLERVMTNLIGNAVKFTDAGSIKVQCHGSDGHVKVLVTDTGRGLGADETEAVFEPFRRLQHTGQTKVQGSGLGLTICRQIVEAHGGRIEATSPGLGKGATFRVWIPRRFGDDSEAAAAPGPVTSA